MKSGNLRILPLLGVLALATMLAPYAQAGCGHYRPASFNTSSQHPFSANLAMASFLGDNADASIGPVLDTETGVTMTGMWHVIFIAKGNQGSGAPPDGAVVDNGLSLWHSDRTEQTLDSRPPQSGDVCFGVWKVIAEREYMLNHFGISFDPATDPQHPQGYVNIRQHIYLNRTGNTFTGEFSIRQYDTTGNLLFEVKGLLKGNRVTQNTTADNLVSQD